MRDIRRALACLDRVFVLLGVVANLSLHDRKCKVVPLVAACFEQIKQIVTEAGGVASGFEVVGAAVAVVGISIGVGVGVGVGVVRVGVGVGMGWG